MTILLKAQGRVLKAADFFGQPQPRIYVNRLADASVIKYPEKKPTVMLKNIKIVWWKKTIYDTNCKKLKAWTKIFDISIRYRDQGIKYW